MAPKPDYTKDLEKYVTSVDKSAVDGIVKHLGIALRGKDSALVASTDPEELKRIREGFLRKKLGLTQSDGALDSAINDVMTRMQDVRDKSRVTVCYLLASKFDKLGAFVKA
jgi:hypothetical protein